MQKPKIKIVSYKEGESVHKKENKYFEEVCHLIAETFSIFNKTEGKKIAVQRYIDYWNLQKNEKQVVQNSFEKTPLFFVALHNNKVVGVIRGNKTRIINLFVEKNYHGLNIGKKLLEKFENSCQRHGSVFIKVRSSLYAVAFYQRAGYKKTTGVRDFVGLKVQPLKKIIVK